MPKEILFRNRNDFIDTTQAAFITINNVGGLALENYLQVDSFAKEKCMSEN
jgi:hypothetical protein